MVPKVLRQRSSLPSSFATGLIGWNGFAIATALLLGYSGPAHAVALAASIAALLQVTALRLGFQACRLDAGVWRGAAWGAVSGAYVVLAEATLLPLVAAHFAVALGVGLYVGPAVGAFLSYFHRDDRRIEAAAHVRPGEADYGRDAHWLDPFAYGAAAYAVALVPLSADLALYGPVIGALTGVVAAGVSHFLLSRAGNAAWTVPVAALAGAVLGSATGFLFRHYEAQLLLPWPAAGALAGAVTFFSTAAVGVALARKERAA